MRSTREFPTFRKTLRNIVRADNLPVFSKSVFLGVFSIFPPRTFYRRSKDKLRGCREEICIENLKRAHLNLPMALYCNLGHDGMGLPWHFISSLGVSAWASRATYMLRRAGLGLPWYYILSLKYRSGPPMALLYFEPKDNGLGLQ